MEHKGRRQKLMSVKSRGTKGGAGGGVAKKDLLTKKQQVVGKLANNRIVLNITIYFSNGHK